MMRYKQRKEAQFIIHKRVFIKWAKNRQNIDKSIDKV